MIFDNNTEDLIKLFIEIKPSLESQKDLLDDNGVVQKIVASAILSNLILSKKVFARNTLVGEFLEEYFDIKISKYMLNSRTLLCGKMTKYIVNLNDTEKLIDILNTLYKILIKIDKNEDIFTKDIYDVIGGIKL